MANGTVKWFNGQKGYGFIQPEEGGNDVFVHISAVERAGLSTLREGQKIAYETETGRNGKVAASICVRSKNPDQFACRGADPSAPFPFISIDVMRSSTSPPQRRELEQGT